MFTGIIEEVGKARSIINKGESAVIDIECQRVLEDIKLGDSIAINGVCLTAVSYNRNSVQFDAVKETLKRTNLGELKSGSPVNLERAMSASGRFGGHIVQGHIDGTATIASIEQSGNAKIYRFNLPSEWKPLVIEKGSIAIDGISLTIAELNDKSFAVWLIPHTQSETALNLKQRGDTVNIELDVLAKYVARMMNVNSSSQGITLEKLRDEGYI